MKEKIKKLDLREEFYTKEECFITEVSNSLDDPQLSISRALVKPGVTTRWHRLMGTTERYVILEGIGCLEVGNLYPEVVNPGDVVIIPPMCRQRISNIGKQDLIFLAICTPRFSDDAYEDIEDIQLTNNQ